MASEIWRLWAVFAAYLGAGLAGSEAGSGASSGAGSGIVTAGVAAVSGMVRADGGALVSNRSRRLGRVSRLEIEIIDCRREVVGSTGRGFG